MSEDNELHKMKTLICQRNALNPSKFNHAQNVAAPDLCVIMNAPK
jgi:hypothetical protein